MNPRLPSLLIGLSALGACATAAPPPGPVVASAADAHRITVEQTNARVDVPVAAGDTHLSPQTQDAVSGFAQSYLRIGHGALVLSTPSGGDNANSAGLMAQQTRLALVDAGVPYAAIAGSTYDASGTHGAPIILSYARYEAYAPKCAPLYTQDLAHQSDNQPWESFGCAQMANFAAMVDDPHDLIEPRAEDPRDSGRRAVVMDAYRQGHQTHAERSSDEHATVSNVAH